MAQVQAAALLCTTNLPTFVLKAVSAMMASLGRMPTCTCSHEWASNHIMLAQADDFKENGCRAMYALSSVVCAKHKPRTTSGDGTQSAMVMHMAKREAH